MKMIFVSLGLLSISGFSVAQDNCGAARYFEKANCQSDPGKCVVMKVNTDPKGKNYTYEWNMGDGKTVRGAVAEHCYDDYGVFYVSLDLLDTQTGVRIKQEVEKTLIIKPVPVIIKEEKIVIGKETRFSYSYEAPAGMRVDKVLWSYGDNSYSCGNVGRHTYTMTGELEVCVLLVATLNDEEILLCGSLTTKVIPGNIDGSLFVDLFEAKEKELALGKRFLEGPMHLVLHPVSDPTQQTTITLERTGYQAEVKPGMEYSVFAFKGNMFVRPLIFHTGNAGEEDRNLTEAIQKLAKQNIEVVDPVWFGLDSDKVDENQFEKTVALVHQIPDIKLAIGIYTHTEGRVESNLKLSRARGETLVSSLVAKGMSKDRIKVYTAREDSRLLNTCAGIQDCAIEDPAYNRKAEIRITQ